MNEYLDRHNKVATFVHWEICKHYCIEVEDKSYNHKPQKDNGSKDNGAKDNGSKDGGSMW